MPNITCQKCGKKFDSAADGIYAGVESSLCPHCGHKNAQSHTTPSTPAAASLPVPPATASGSTQTPPPSPKSKLRPEFDANRQGRFFPAYAATIKALLMNPKDYFQKYELFQNLQSLFLFAYCNHLFALLPMMLVQALFFFLIGSLGQLDEQAHEIMQYIPGFVGLYFVFGLILLPPLYLLLTVIWAGIHHFFLKIIGNTQKDFSTTLQLHLHFSFIVVVMLPFSILGMVPILGVLASLAMLVFIVVYAIFYHVVGMAEVHGISTDRAVFALIGLVVVCCCCCFLPWPILAGFMGAANH